MAEFYCTLDLILKNKRIKKTEFVRMTGLSFPTIDRLCQGDVSRFDAGTIVAVCKALDISPGDFLKVKLDNREDEQPSAYSDEDLQLILLSTFIDVYWTNLFRFQEKQEARRAEFIKTLTAQINEFLASEEQRCQEHQLKSGQLVVTQLLNYGERTLTPSEFKLLESGIAKFSYPQNFDDLKLYRQRMRAIFDHLGTGKPLPGMEATNEK